MTKLIGAAYKNSRLHCISRGTIIVFQSRHLFYAHFSVLRERGNDFKQYLCTITCTFVLHSRQLDLGERDDSLASAEWLQGDGNNLANAPKKDVDEATGSPEGGRQSARRHFDAAPVPTSRCC